MTTKKKNYRAEADETSQLEAPSAGPELWWIRIGTNWKAVKDRSWYGARAQFIVMGYTQADPKTASQIRATNAKALQNV